MWAELGTQIQSSRCWHDNNAVNGSILGLPIKCQ